MRISDWSSDVCSSDLVVIPDHRKVYVLAAHILDVLRPAMMIADLVDAKADQLRVPFIELGLQACKLPQFGRADRRVILGERKKNGPIGAQPTVEQDQDLGGFRSQLRGEVAQL